MQSCKVGTLVAHAISSRQGLLTRHYNTAPHARPADPPLLSPASDDKDRKRGFTLTFVDKAGTIKFDEKESGIHGLQLQLCPINARDAMAPTQLSGPIVVTTDDPGVCNPHAIYQSNGTNQRYKSKRQTVLLVQPEPYTSKTCGQCGNLNDRLGSSRTFACSDPECQYVADRDHNGAYNMAIRAIRPAN
ncbi:hypothetical protein PHSY_006326 [Pseudozyma hubeiensis SY62]|uniref:Cas12f1-like TNB domain-containing protein n=1 Tax=Pseudozyma hubeiensis (strain SY62) TaxID=1305764 RepID=R9PBW4_PSEHS|nr:hypothetical protein PHSY_006326 [Pseudozyma hubeiensis SY62]GAC98732.1 hypothetical protein PHSY_006326 [Pseudozyma hubeiensis SY62]